MKNRKIFIFILLCFIQFIIIIWYKKLHQGDILQVEYGNNELFFSYLSEELYYEDGSNIQINSYQDENTGEYFMFLPDSFKKNESHIKLYGAEEMVVNQKSYNSGSPVGFLEEGRYSIAVNQTFYILNVMYGANIPSIFINLNTDSLQYVQESKENFDSGYINIYDGFGKTTYKNELIDIHGRGNSSWEYQLMKGYAITIGSEAPLVADRVSDKWNLIGNGYDPSLIENAMMYDLAEDIGLEYSPKVQHVDLYMEGEYVGVYLLSTKVAIRESSVNIENLEKKTEAVNALPLYEYERYGSMEGEIGKSKGVMIPNNPTDITGGYLIEQDHQERYAVETSGFVTDRSASFVIKSPEYASREQAEYIREFVQEVEDAMNEKDGNNPTSKKHYSQYIDVDSFVKSYLLQEISKNMDMNLTSQFFYKKPGKNTLLYAGPVWDFDYTFGMADLMVSGTNLNSPKDLLIEHYEVEGPSAFNFSCLYRHESFQKSVKTIYWEELRKPMQDLLDGGIEEYVGKIESSAKMNQARWGIEEEYKVQIQEIKTFIEARMVYLDKVWEIRE